jgi:hypothetical protein
MKTRNTNYRGNALAPVGIVLALVLSANIAAAQDVSAGDSDRESSKLFYPPHSRPFHTSFPEWTAQWWQYVLSIPVGDNPIVNDTGKDCRVGQRGPVWFLVGSMGSKAVTRRCSIPEDRALFFPIINQADINDPLKPQTVEELRAETAPCIDAVDVLSVEVDGEPIDNLKRFRVKSVPFDIALPRNNVLGIDIKQKPFGIYSPVIDDGFYVMLKPLDEGQHTIHIYAHRQPATDFCPDEFSQDITYLIKSVEVNLR